MMNDQPIHYAILRSLDRWDENARQAGLEPQTDGTLRLARIPGTEDGKPIVVSKTPVFPSSGLAAGDCKDLYIADTDNHRIVVIDTLCEARTLLGVGGPSGAPGQFHDPRGLLVVQDNLYVADSSNGRVQVFRLPSLELRAIWEGPLQVPIALAADSQGRIYVLDTTLQSVLRFSVWGVPDEGYNTQMIRNLKGSVPVSIAVDREDKLYVSAEPPKGILRFDKNATPLPDIPELRPQHPSAMAMDRDLLYVVDQSSGEIWILDCKAGIFLGALPGYHGPVSALAVDESGTLYIKPGLDETYHVLPANKAYVPSGNLTAGPFDAGLDLEWERVHADVELPGDTDVVLHLFAGSKKSPSPNWNGSETLSASLDTLVPKRKPTGALLPEERRYLWLRLDLHSDSQHRTSPQLIQVQAETAAESYLDYLPAVYSRKDAAEHFLERWLALFRAQLGDLELLLEEMPRRFDALTAPEDHLKWLASWLGLDPPLDLPGSELRVLIPRLHRLYEQRGTPFGVREFVELYTGVRPALLEAFRERHIWQLGYTSVLGFDTALAEDLPDGMTVPGHTLADASCQGLRRDCYSGVEFEQFETFQIDPIIDFGEKPSASIESKKPFSIRWTGQILPLTSERYTFHVLSDDSIRLWVDGILIVDRWIDPPAAKVEHSSVSVELEAERWYTLQLEYRKKKGKATIRLAWSSRKQKKEVIPKSQLYSLRDERARFELQENEGTMLVGEALVGRSGPLNKSDFGMPLFSEAAHLFTIVVPAGALPGHAQREMLQRVIEAEKPAHTDYHLCFVEPHMRVGFQARLGVDSIVAQPRPPMELNESTLGMDSYLEEKEPTSRVGQSARLGQDTQIG
jgi:phage tail-like protein